MRRDVLLPQWGMGMSEGFVLNWLKSEGDPVAEGEDLVEIEAEKTTQIVPAPFSGVLVQIVAREEDTVPVRSVLAVIDAD